MKIVYFILRLIACPFVLCLGVIFLNFQAIKRTVLFIIYGGEFINYEEKMDKYSIQDVYLKIVEQQNNC